MPSEGKKVKKNKDICCCVLERTTKVMILSADEQADYYYLLSYDLLIFTLLLKHIVHFTFASVCITQEMKHFSVVVVALPQLSVLLSV